MVFGRPLQMLKGALSWSLRVPVTARGVFDFVNFGRRRSFAGQDRTDEMLSELVDPLSNSAVAICLRKTARAMLEAPWGISEGDLDDAKWLSSHPLLDLLKSPDPDNPKMTGKRFMKLMVRSWELAGDAYAWKRRGPLYQVIGLYWLDPTRVRILGNASTSGEAARGTEQYNIPGLSGDGAPLAAYEYTDGDGKKHPLLPQDVVHISNDVNDVDPRYGLSLMRSLWRETYADDESARWVATTLKNGLSTPGIMSGADPNNPLTSNDIKLLRQQLDARVGGDNRGDVLISNWPIKFERINLSPEEMSFRETRIQNEERISGAMGVPAIVAGLGAGLTRSTYSNYSEARYSWHHDDISTKQREFAEQMSEQLIYEFDSEGKLMLRFDTRNVKALQEDADLVHARARADAGGKPIISIQEARAMIGLDGPVPEELIEPPLYEEVVELDERDEEDADRLEREEQDDEQAAGRRLVRIAV